MNKTVKRQWLKALRSGKYKQGQNRLRTNTDGYCCLGVLCDLYDKTLQKSKWKEVKGTFSDVTEWWFGKAGVDLPRRVQLWAGLNDSDPMLHPDKNICASQANDSFNYKFKRIARLIEKHL